MENICSKCGKIHEGWPALGYSAPRQYYALSEEDKKKYVKELTSDFCVLEYENQTDRFIRCVLYQNVKDHCEDLRYGVWASLSESSFQDYKANFFSEDYNTAYFGYLCTHISDYEDMDLIRTKVIVTGGRNRPEVIPHDDQMENAFVRDYYNGITKDEAERRIDRMRNNK